MKDKPDIHVPHYPTYDVSRAFLRSLEGQSERTFMRLRATIEENLGTPQENRDWSQPEQWFPEFLSGAERELAEHIWSQSHGLVNPRHMIGVWLLCSSYKLLVTQSPDILRITSDGQSFLEYPLGEVEQQLDFSEGLLHLLTIIAEHGPGKRSDLLPHYTHFLSQYSRIRSKAAASSNWYARISNLVHRELVNREGNSYRITQQGLNYLAQSSGFTREGSDTQSEKTSALLRLVAEQESEVHRQIAEALTQHVTPYQLEYLIKTLLEAMGYKNVEVTKKTGDGGIDVVGDIRVGITDVREVVQVKHRPNGTIQRPVLDQLRGSLHRFNATRGTIITTGRFSKGAKEAAFELKVAPITLIDGERLVDLLIEHEIGAEKSSIVVWKFSSEYFRSGEEQSET